MMRSPGLPNSLALLAGPALLGLALVGCGQNYDSPVVLVYPEAPTTTDTLRVQVADRAGVEYEIAWYVDGEAVDDVDFEVPARLTARGQTWEVVVTPIETESGERAEPTSKSVTIQNAAPYGIVSLAPSRPQAGVDLMAVPGFVDPDGDEVTYTFAWTKNGSGGGSDATIPGDSLKKGDTWEVTIVGTDGTDQSEPVIGSVQVANSPPSVAGARVVPDVVYDDTDVQCEGIGFEDADGDSEGFEVLWIVDGFEVSTDETLTGELFSRGQSVWCVLTPTDGEDRGVPVSSLPVEVGNGAPSIDSVVIDTTSPTRNAPITFTANGVTDADGDEVELKIWWVVNGRGVSNDPELDPELFHRGDLVSVRVTPNDGRIDGEEVSSSEVLVVNAPPVIDESDFRADPVYTDSLLAPKVIYSDADGDDVTLTFEWKVNGSVVGDDTGTLDGAEHFDRGDTVAYKVTPNDGIVDGTAYSSSAESVENKPPSTPGMEISPKPTLPDKDVYCEITEDSVDADGDSLTYIFTWEKNGSVYAGLTEKTVYAGDTIPYAETELKQEWSCSVVVNDGTDDSEEVVDLVKIRPENIYYYAEDKSDLLATSSSCTSDGKTGYYGYLYYTDAMGWKWDDDYTTKPSEVVFNWRQGLSSTSSTYRYVYINGTYFGYVNLGISSSSSCDSGKTYGVRVSGDMSWWKSGATNTFEIRPPCCSYVNLGVFEDDEYKYGRLEPKE